MRMTTKILFKTDKKLKDALMKKAKKQGLTMSAVFNMAAQAYVDDRIQLSVFERDLMRGMTDVRAGRVHTLDEVAKELGIDA